MADMKPFFLTGANARILLNNKTMAFATDISYRITVKHATPRVLGRAEVETIQPLTYDVSGSLTIIRYGRGLKNYFGDSAPADTSNKGNSVGSFGPDSPLGEVGAALGLPSSTGIQDGAPHENFDPSRFFQAKMFDIEIRQTGILNPKGKKDNFLPEPPVQGTGEPNSGTSAGKALKKASQVGNSLAHTQSNLETPVVLLRDCRFEDFNFVLNKRSVATITMSFKARYVDDDTMLARKSGSGQEFV